MEKVVSNTATIHIHPSQRDGHGGKRQSAYTQKTLDMPDNRYIIERYTKDLKEVMI